MSANVIVGLADWREWVEDTLTGLRGMFVENGPHQPRYWGWQHSKELVLPAKRSIVSGYKGLVAAVIPKIVNGTLSGAPTQLESAKSLVTKGRPSKIQRLDSFMRKPLNRLPHHEVIGSKLLEFVIRRTVFVNRRRPKSKKNGPCNGDSADTGKRNPTLSRL
jgi:hypothetical protein